MRRETTFWVLMACSLVAGMVILAFAEYLPEVVGSLGEPLVIAAFLASTVDFYAKRRLAADVARDVSPFMMGHWLPEPFKDELRNLMQIVLYRTNFELEYELERIPENPEYVLMNGRVRFNVENLSEVPQRYRYALFVERKYENVPGLRLERIRCAGIEGLGEGKNIYEHGDIGEDKPGTRMKVWEREVMVPPTRQGAQRITCYGEVAQVFTKDDSDSFTFLWPTIGARVTVRRPEDMHVQVSFGHRNRDLMIKLPPENPFTWELDGAFLPFQSIMVEWTVGEPPQEAVRWVGEEVGREEERAGRAPAEAAAS